MNGEVGLINQILVIIIDGYKRWKESGNSGNSQHAKVKIH